MAMRTKLAFKDDISDEWYFPRNRYIISEIDDKGLITYINEVFCEIADYKEEELIGQAHNIVRHPNMPKVAFSDLWEKKKIVVFGQDMLKINVKMVGLLGFCNGIASYRTRWNRHLFISANPSA